MLTISKKAASEADSRAILESSLQLTNVFNIPTLILMPDQFERESFWSSLFFDFTYQKIKQRMSEILVRHGHPPCSPFDVQTFRARIHITELQTIQERAAIRAGSLSSIHPPYNIVCCAHGTEIAKMFMGLTLHLPEKNLPDYPGYDSQYSTLILWHELGHGLTSDESVADKVSALAFRQYFHDLAPVYVWADARAAQAVIGYRNTRLIQTYGWKVVDALDHVLKLDEDTVRKNFSSLARDNPESLKPFFNHCHDLEKVGERLSRTANRAFNNRDLSVLAKAGQHLIDTRIYANDVERRILERFTLAARRLSIGKAAYAEFSL